MLSSSWQGSILGPSFLRALCKWIRVIKYYQLSWYRKLATVKSLKADDSSFSPALERMITLWRMENARIVSLICNYLRWPINTINSVDNIILLCYTLPPTQHHSFFRNLPFNCYANEPFLFRGGVVDNLCPHQFASNSFTYMTTDGVKGLFLTQKQFVRHHFYWLRKWQSWSLFVWMATLQWFFCFVNQERAQLLCNNGDNTVFFFAYKERNTGSLRIQFTRTSLELETRSGDMETSSICWWSRLHIQMSLLDLIFLWTIFFPFLFFFGIFWSDISNPVSVRHGQQSATKQPQGSRAVHTQHGNNIYIVPLRTTLVYGNSVCKEQKSMCCWK